MKVMQVIHYFLPYSTGGSEVYAYNLSKELANKHKVFVFHSISDKSMEEYEMNSINSSGIEIYRINNTWKNCDSFEMTYRNDKITQKFAALLDTIKPEVVHFHHLTCLSITLVEEAGKRKIPIVFTLHDYWLVCQRGQLLKRDLTPCRNQSDVECVRCLANQLNISTKNYKKLCSLTQKMAPNLQSSYLNLKRVIRKCFVFCSKVFFLAQKEAISQIQKRTGHIREMCAIVDLFISPSRFLMEKYREFGIPEEKILYSDYGMNVKLAENFSKKSSQAVRFGFIGNIIPSKGLHILIKAFNKLQNSDVVLKIYGLALPYDGFKNYLQLLKGMVTNPKISFMGKYDNEKLASILAGMDVLIVPSLWYENSPLTIHEAFMAKMPVIASNIGGIPELVQDGENGFLFRAGDPEDLYQKLCKFIKEPGLIEKFKKNVASVKTIKRNAEELENIYVNLIKT